MNSINEFITQQSQQQTSYDLIENLMKNENINFKKAKEYYDKWRESSITSRYI